MNAFKSLIQCNLTAEVLRSIALFITYGLHKAHPPLPRQLRSKASTLQLRYKPSQSPSRKIPSVSVPPNPPSSYASSLTRTQLAISVLEMYCDLLCEDGRTSNIKKFARTVTNKVSWILVLWANI